MECSLEMREQRGNMYSWVTHTWNPVKGKCPHECNYCYMRRFPQKELRLVDSDFIDLGKGNTIFVCSGTDLFANTVPIVWISKVLEWTRKYPNNTYLFQTKNPNYFHVFLKKAFPPNTILGTTLETNKQNLIKSKAPSLIKRAIELTDLRNLGFKTVVSIEPIMDFDLKEFIDLIKPINPAFVSIGADSKNNSLVEPTYEKIKELEKRLKAFTKVKLKDNLKRLGGLV